MRDPDRIPLMAMKLAEAWLEVPDQRLGQFIINLNPKKGMDPFYVEDDEWEAALDKILDE